MLTGGKTIALAASLSLMATPAAAQSPQPTDPSPSSPSGQIYEIPVDRARKDAAPKRRDRGQKGSRPTGERPASSIRSSDNGFGTSSEVPGAGSPSSSSPQDDDRSTASGSGRGGSGGSGSRDAGGTGGDSGSGGTDGPGSGGTGGSGSGGSGGSGGTGEGPAEGITGATPAGSADKAGVAPSSTRAGLTLGLAALVGLGLGLAGRSAARRRLTP